MTVTRTHRAPPSPSSRGGAPRPHVGVLVPVGNVVVRSELILLRPGAAHYHYVPISVGPDGLHAAVTAGLGELNDVPVSGVLLAQTTPVDLAWKAPVVTAFDAVMTGLRRAGIRRVALATPRGAHATAALAAAMTSRGVEVTGQAGLDWTGDPAQITAGHIWRLVRGLGHDALTAADVLVLGSTTWRTRELLTELSDYYGLRALSSTWAMAQYAATKFTTTGPR